LDESTIISVGGLIVAAFSVGASLWWNYATRTSEHREYLYESQMKMYADIVNATMSATQPIEDLLKKRRRSRKELDERTRAAKDMMRVQFTKGMAIVPDNVLRAIYAVYLALEKLEKRRNPDKKVREDLISTEYELYDAIRKAAGTEPLSDEMRRIFGQRAED
jgi:hypothetical protein